MGEHERAMMMTNHSRREEGGILRIGSVAGIVGSLLAMVGNLLHPATPIGDPEGVAQTIAQSENWVLVHLVIVVGRSSCSAAWWPSPARSRAEWLAP